MKKKNRSGLATRLLALSATIFLFSCSPPQRNHDPLPRVETEPNNAISITALSTKPWLVTGGDVLLRITLPQPVDTNAVVVLLNDEVVTQSFRPVANIQGFEGLLKNLVEGDNLVKVSVQGTELVGTLTITNYPITGPIISGPHERPYLCRTEEFALVTGEPLGVALDPDCSVATRVDYVYWSATEAQFKPYVFPGPESAEVGAITLADGSTVPFFVRVETGSVNRAIYETAMLHVPDDPLPNPWSRSAMWNGKLVYTHGGGCRGGWYQQGNQTGGVLRKELLEMGYAITSATHNVFGQNCNDLLASETHIMVKERFIETYGVPEYTIGTGGSGGSYQSHQTADNYPGIFDGIIVSSSFPDVASATIFTLADARLLNYYFTNINIEGFTPEQQLAVSGFGSHASIANLARGAARLDPIYEFDAPLEEQGGEVGIEALRSQLYQESFPSGVRATVYDHTVNVYGTVENGRMAARPLDNTGVQYGLAALNAGVISVAQFIALNRDIGGFDRDMNHVPQRHSADAMASRRAVETGRILYGGAGLSETPIIDYRSYTDDSEMGDIHMIVHQYSTRQRLLDANGHADNHVMSVGGLWGFTADEPDLGVLFRDMDNWLTAIADDGMQASKAEKIARNKPNNLGDNCWDYTAESRVNIKEALSFDGKGRCAELYPAFPTPRQVAGAPLANNIVSCQFKPVDASDYAVALSDEELAELRTVFPAGVCDWTRGDKHKASYQGTWLSFGPSPVNRIQ